ncbi:MAG: hypothetical protein KAT48_11990, partial [Bacteroidales bacterium]|nr:hypothetical protein [Bacteroidales bacterium]
TALPGICDFVPVRACQVLHLTVFRKIERREEKSEREEKILIITRACQVLHLTVFRKIERREEKSEREEKIPIIIYKKNFVPVRCYT